MKGENPQRKTHKETPRNAIAWTASSGNAHSWGVEWDTRTQAKAEAFHEMEPWQFMKWGTHSSWNGAFQVAVLDLALNLRRRWRRLLGELPEAEVRSKRLRSCVVQNVRGLSLLSLISRSLFFVEAEVRSNEIQCLHATNCTGSEEGCL